MMDEQTMRYILMLLALLSLSSCYTFWNWSVAQELPVWEKKIDAEAVTCLILDYTTRLHYEHHLRLENSLVFYDKHINKIRLEFITQDLMELREARDLLVDMVEDLLSLLNEDQHVGCNLNFTFSANNLEIYINCESYWGLFGDPLYIGWILLQDGMTFLYASEIKHNEMDWWHSRVEPYSKSREIVFCQRIAEENYRSTLPPAPASKLQKEQYQEYNRGTTSPLYQSPDVIVN
jgi:hypothetical protein